jgi:transglutaminase-like putative cysteine protease
MAIELPEPPISPGVDMNIMCLDECAEEGIRQCSDITNYQVCGNYDSDICLEWGSEVACPIKGVEYQEQTKCRTIEESQDPIVYKNPITYTGSYNYKVDFGNNDLTKTDVYVPTPAEWDSQKDVDLIYPSFDIYTLNMLGIDVINGNKYLKYNEEDRSGEDTPWGWEYYDYINSYQKFKFTSYEVSTDTSMEEIQPYNTNSELYVKYTKHENKIETDSFRSITPSIVGDETNPIKKARKIYDYIIEDLVYSEVGGLQGALYAYDNKACECGDYSALFVAMARSVGIPARPVVGFWADPSSGDTHVWAEFYVEGVGWIPVDPTIGQQSQEKREYYFGNLDNKRLIMSKNYNIQLDSYNVDLFQVGAYWWWYQGTFDRDPIVDFSYLMLEQESSTQEEEKNGECGFWCGDGSCNRVIEAGFDDPFGWGGSSGFEYVETCTTCSEDCGECTYGVQGGNNEEICGWVGSSIRTKIGNLQVSSTEILKNTTKEWIYSNENLYHQVKNNQFDYAVQEIAWNMGNIYNYCSTPCPYNPNKGYADTSASNILNGVCGLCADWANTWTSLLRTMNVPPERAFTFCYRYSPIGTDYSGHCVAIYISDSGEQWILNYGSVYNTLEDTGYACTDSGSTRWGNDQGYGWANKEGVC